MSTRTDEVGFATLLFRLEDLRAMVDVFHLALSVAGDCRDKGQAEREIAVMDDARRAYYIIKNAVGTMP